MFSFVWDLVATMGKLVACLPGASWPSESSKKHPERFPIEITEDVGAQVNFVFTLRPSFRKSNLIRFVAILLESSTLDPFEPAQSKPKFAISDKTFEVVRFLSRFDQHFRYMSNRNPLKIISESN